MSVCRHYRRRLLESLGTDLRTEVAFINDVTRDDNAKNYQLWCGPQYPPLYILRDV